MKAKYNKACTKLSLKHMKISMPSGGEMVDDLWCGLGYSHAKKLSLDHLRQLRDNLLQAGFGPS